MTPSPKFDPAAWQPKIHMVQYPWTTASPSWCLPDSQPAHRLLADPLQGGLPA